MLYVDFIKTKSQCPFCGNRQEQIFKTEHAYLTYALAPYSKHHLLVIPNRHIESIRDMTPEETRDIDILERKALDILNKLGYKNATFLIREGTSSDKSVAHLHFHVIPQIPIGPLDNDSREREIMTEQEVMETISDIKKFL